MKHCISNFRGSSVTQLERCFLCFCAVPCTVSREKEEPEATCPFSTWRDLQLWELRRALAGGEASLKKLEAANRARKGKREPAHHHSLLQGVVGEPKGY